MRGEKGALMALVATTVLAMSGCSADASGGEETASSADEIGFAESGEWKVFPLQAGPNPAAKIGGSVRGFISPEIDRTMLILNVRGMPANKTFGAHLHAAACDDNKGGGHYQQSGTAANADNEVWLDLTTDGDGRARVLNRKAFAITADKAKSVVVHANPTDPATGKAGDKLACVDVSFVEGASGTPSPGKSCKSQYECINGACACTGDKAGTSCAAADSCERTCSTCQ